MSKCTTIGRYRTNGHTGCYRCTLGNIKYMDEFTIQNCMSMNCYFAFIFKKQEETRDIFADSRHNPMKLDFKFQESVEFYKISLID